MRNGLYKVAFETPLGAGSGVINLSDGRISGGDGTMYYVGTYALDGTNFTASVQFKKHSDFMGVTSVFGVDEAEIHLTGQYTEVSAKVIGSSPQAPHLKFAASLMLLV